MDKAEHGTFYQPAPVNVRKAVQLANSSATELEVNALLKNHVSLADTNSVAFPQQRESGFVVLRSSWLGAEHLALLFAGLALEKVGWEQGLRVWN